MVSEQELESTREIARRVIEEVLNGESAEARFEAADELLAEDIVDRGLGAGSETHGREAWKASLETWRGTVPDDHTEIDDLLVEGDRAVAFCTRTGTHEGVLVADGNEFPPTDEAFEIPIVHRFRIEDGRVVESWRLADALGMARQLGLLPDSPGAMIRLVVGQVRHRLGGRTRSRR